MAPEEMIRLFNAVDTDHCGRIYYSDFLATMLQFRLRVHDSLLRHTFNQLDVDRQGLITVENLRTILGKTFEGEQVEECMREVKGIFLAPPCRHNGASTYPYENYRDVVTLGLGKSKRGRCDPVPCET